MREKLSNRKSAGWFLVLAGAVFAPACGGDDSDPQSGASLHDEAAKVVLGGTCSASSCHGEAPGSAELLLNQGADLRALFVGVPACKAPSLDLVQPGEPENSWLYIKLTGAADGSGNLTPMPDVWGESADDCDGVPGFGKRMPESVGMLKADQIETIRRWIAAGAPGPQG
jgi:hypothetical protein